MHKFVYNIQSLEEYVSALKRGLHGPNKSFVEKQEALLTGAYASYLSHTNPCELEKLSPLWCIQEDDTTVQKEYKTNARKTVHDLYDTKEAFKEDHWEELRRLNGGRGLKCPICGIQKCKHLDHYIPREQMPEFSIFPPNLIPTCEVCNGKKHEKWLNEDDERIVFNAFFDELPDKPICECVITLDKHGMPKGEIKIGPLLDANNPIDRRVLATIEKLELIQQVWQPECDILFNKELVRLIDDYDPVSFPNVDDYWNHKHRVLPGYQRDDAFTSFLHGIIYRSMLESQIVKDWLFKKFGAADTEK